MEKFSYEANGYNRSEVNQFIDEVIKETENIVSRVREQKDEIEKLKEEIEQYKATEATLNSAIMKAEKNAEEIKNLSKENADLIIQDAKENASRIVNDALLKAEELEQKRQLLERNMQIFKKKLKLIVSQQMAVAEEIEVLELEE